MRPQFYFALAGCLFGCSVIINGELVSVHCEEEGAVGPPACPLAQTCREGVCVSGPSADAKLGTPCSEDRDCADTDFCFDPAIFGGEGRKVCSRPCCSSGDCDPEVAFVCWVPVAGGGNFCREGKLIGRPEVGTRNGAEACERDDQCRSGLCGDPPNGCVDPCCSDTNCAAADALCTLSRSGGGTSWACESASEKKPLYERCAADDECSSGLCIVIGAAKRCSVPCCSSAACGFVTLQAGPSLVTCENVEHEGTLVRACSGLAPDKAVKLVGEVCTNNEECRSTRCVNDGAESRCSDVCCIDSSCGDPTLFVCRPSHLVSEMGSSWALRCQAK
jgi:hypothetical protein